MDTEQQVRLKFLEEAEDCLDSIESILLGLGNAIPDPQVLDRALRAAHSVKGGAAMMGFVPLSQVAHRLEEYFKILRIRPQPHPLNTEVETLLLQGLDCLRQVSALHRQGAPVEAEWIATHTQPIFEQLHHHLGELRPEDEDALLAQEEDVDPAMLMFEAGVESTLDRLNAQWADLSPAALARELKATAQELADFGRMARLEAFVQLSQSVQLEADLAAAEQMEPICRQALKLWGKSLSLVALRRLDNLPTQLTPASVEVEPDPSTLPDLSALDNLDALNTADIEAVIASLDLGADSWETDISELQVAEAAVALVALEEQLPSEAFDPISPPELEIPLANLSFEAVAPGETVLQDIPPESFVLDDSVFGEIDTAFLESLQEIVATAIPEATDLNQLSEVTPAALATPAILQPISQPIPSPAATALAAEALQTVRVPVKYLQQFNTLFGQLILERNAINLRLEQLQTFTTLMQERMQRLEQSNRHLRQWYDRASMEGLIPVTDSTSSSGTTPSPEGSSLTKGWTSVQSQFDSLEMDRYSDLHLVSQEQIETIVQLQEASADIDLSLQGMTQSVRDLNQTTRSLQTNIARTQMVPFADAVKRFPRVIRDLSVQCDKPVKLQLSGENTLIDRAILDNLSDPLLHLLRNAFDHGIEPTEMRIAAGKPVEGTITLQASHRGGQTVITISDDGGGIRLDRIRARLKELGLPADQIDRLEESKLVDFIFEAGFSTASSVTELSGRGVGMDVVRANLQKLRGDIRVATQSGQGTTFTIRVPFTLSILRVMLLERAGLAFAMSVDNVKQVVRLQEQQIAADGSYWIWQDRTIPLLQMEQGLSFSRPCKPFEFPGTPTIAQPTIVLAGDDNVLAGFCIDRFWGEQEVALRAIETPMPLPPGFNSSIILGDGRVVPLVDPVQLAAWMLASGALEQSASHAEDGDRPIWADTAAQTDTILVVDDSINVRRYLALTLEKAGYQVEQARDGQEAVERLCGGLRVQAVVCDVEMPRLDGYGVLETLRARADFELLPITMLTSRSSDKHRKLAMNLGASAYFAKPYTEQELLQTLKALIYQFKVAEDSSRTAVSV
jgi:chemosensory pili system protein ChpA (sensor histidine kinase/response regulator)